MVKTLVNFIKKMPRWIVFQIDLLLCAFAFWFAVLIKYTYVEFNDLWQVMTYAFPVFLIIKAIFFLIFRTYTGMIKYSSTVDAKRIFNALISAFLAIFVIDVFSYYLNESFLVPIPILIVDLFASLLFMVSFRVTSKIIFYEYKNFNQERVNIVIYGAGEAGVITYRTISQDADFNYRVVAFFDDDPLKTRNSIDGVKIYDPKKQDLGAFIRNRKVDQLIIAINKIGPERKNEIVDVCLSTGVSVKNIPPVYKWINGELSFKQLRDIKIEDLLGRETIDISNDSISSQIKGKRVLVTGAAGSIGSELVRQIVKFAPEKVVLFDQAETPLYDLELELTEMSIKVNFDSVLGSISNFERVERAFNIFKPDIVFHAAAYKHVPMMEDNPSESINVNIRGTKILADASVKYGVNKFIMISTDKAVNPTNVMGASKRIAEIYTQSLNYASINRKTKFITTRFGNVLGSNGSVIPRFRKQIREGGPITITHPEITRYFMTIPEACQLVMEAATMGKGGEIFIFDMGRSIKIVDLATKMVKLSGLDLGKDIQLLFTGLRPGEKLYEELLADKETTIPTHHEKIMIAHVREYKFEKIYKQISELISLFAMQDNNAVILKMKEIVPEYVSKNSKYESIGVLKKASG